MEIQSCHTFISDRIVPVAQCPSCTSTIPEDCRYCPHCGQLIDVSAAVTRPAVLSGDQSARKDSQTSLGPHSDPGIRSGGFTAGQVVNGRYRIEALLGRGGMGDVYRAEDLKLGQIVALKFLQPDLSHDPERLSRFLDEVRVARTVSHPNVCRVYDIGEVDGQHFLSMEYIAGEDLGGLLRRIGRLPEDKALDISRQLCAGLAAAHKQGILHRDLKPANIMLDSDGMVRITDFGLASLVEEIDQADVRSGTPAYMSPEQLHGVEVSTRSDIFSLGLVLYEIFTGKRVFDAKTFEQLTSLHDTPRVSPRDLNKGVDAAVDRVILKCLESNPELRPESALDVAAALPGGDPLAAALLAGETPSPELVAAAGSSGKLAPLPALLCLGAVVLGGLVLAFLGNFGLLGLVPLTRPPEALVDTAQNLLREFGYEEPFCDSAYGFTNNRDYLQHIDESDSSLDRWAILGTGRPPGIFFWYRQSPRPLAGTRSSQVHYDDPPPLISGMKRLNLTPDGLLMNLEIVPVEGSGETADPALDWGAVFEKAGLDLDNFRESESGWIPPVYADQRGTWVGKSRDSGSSEIRVEAGAFRGRPVYFHTIHPWTRELRIEPRVTTSGEILSGILGVIFLSAMILGSILLALRNIKKGRGDQSGAFKISLYLLLTSLLAWVLQAHHVADLSEEVFLIVRAISISLFYSCLVWLFYVSLEPYLRRRWPEGVLSWSRLLTGHFRDPLVGRDLLIGTVFGTLLAILITGGSWLTGVLTSTPPVPHTVETTNLLGPLFVIGNLLENQLSAVASGIGFFFVLLLMRLLLRKDWLALLVVFGFAVVQNALRAPDLSGTFIVTVFMMALAWCLVVFLMLRFGLLAGVAGLFSANFLLSNPLMTDFSAWYASVIVFSLGVVILLAGYGCLISIDRSRFAIGDLD